MYYNLSCPPAELMEGQATPGIITIHYYFIMPAGVILTAARMKEYIKEATFVTPALGTHLGNGEQGQDSAGCLWQNWHYLSVTSILKPCKFCD